MNADRLLIAAFVVLIAALTFYFPGHTWLQADTQIYIPLIEHIDNPAALSRDFLVSNTHLAFTLYDEIARALHRLTGASYESVLIFQQAITRALGVLGIYLLAAAMPMARKMALLVAALASLGTLLAGPAVLTIEYEPTPRAFALPLVLLAIGLSAHDRQVAAAIAASCAFLYHPPTAAPFWLLFFPWLFVRGAYRAMLPFAAAAVVLLVSSRLQAGATEPQAFLWRISPWLESVQRYRAPYNWIGAWGWRLLAQYTLLWAVAMAAYRRVRPQRGRLFLIGLPLVGLLSIPFSWLSLDVLKWGLIPQLQPARAALFIELFAVVLTAAAGVRAAYAGKLVESCAWFLVPFLLPVQPRIFEMMPLRQWAVVLLLAVGTVAAISLSRRRATHLAVLAYAVVPFFAIPLSAGVENYPALHTPEIEQLVNWARANTPPDAMFVFPDAGHDLYPGVFRAEAERALYVDWKSGGQVNYYDSMARIWLRRWQRVRNYDPAALPALCAAGVNYIVLDREHALPGTAPVFQNAAFVVYRCPLESYALPASARLPERAGSDATPPQKRSIERTTSK